MALVFRYCPRCVNRGERRRRGLTPPIAEPYGLGPVIERVVLHQSRFRTPGLVPDARGVALGPLGMVLLSSPERLVSFLRATGEEGALDELLDSLRIVQVVSPLRTREMVVEVQASSSHRMDRIAAIARLLGGMVFTGSGRHFVKYRDAQAPFGYDIGELLADPGDIALYHDRFAQPYKVDRTLAIRDLILRLTPVQVPRGRAETPRMLYALVHLGLGESVVGYLARWAVNAPRCACRRACTRLDLSRRCLRRRGWWSACTNARGVSRPRP